MGEKQTFPRILEERRVMQDSYMTSLELSQRVIGNANAAQCMPEGPEMGRKCSKMFGMSRKIMKIYDSRYFA